MDDNAKHQSTFVYRERVTPNFTSFLPTLLFMPALALTFAPFSWFAGLIAGVAISASAIILMIMLSPVIEISGTSLRVGRAVIERKHLANPVEVEPAQRFAATRTELSALAYLSLQASVKGLVRVDLTDPEDPTPYWLFSSRNAAQVVRALSTR